MAKEKINLPSSGAGITRYFEESRSKITIKPSWVILFAAAVCLLVLALNLF